MERNNPPKSVSLAGRQGTVVLTLQLLTPTVTSEHAFHNATKANSGCTRDTNYSTMTSHHNRNLMTEPTEKTRSTLTLFLYSPARPPLRSHEQQNRAWHSHPRSHLPPHRLQLRPGPPLGLLRRRHIALTADASFQPQRPTLHPRTHPPRSSASTLRHGVRGARASRRDAWCTPEVVQDRSPSRTYVQRIQRNLGGS